MKIGFYNQWLTTLGGGEKHCLSIAAQFAEWGHDVTVFGRTHVSEGRITERFNLSVGGLCFRFLERAAEHEISEASRDFDLFINCSAHRDLIQPRARKNVALVFFPLPLHRHQLGFSEASARISQYEAFWANSQFTRNWLRSYWDVNADVLYPLVEDHLFSAGQKRKAIISVGRFFTGGHSKKHSVLIQAFKIAVKRDLEGWTLFLVGALGEKEQDQSYFRELQGLATGAPIELVPNAPFNLLREFYSQASLYWHATGFQEVESQTPENCEHFGITTVEAMASGCVPVVFPAGGQKEIVTHLQNGLYWANIDDLVGGSCKLAADGHLQRQLAMGALSTARSFGRKFFAPTLNKLFKQLFQIQRHSTASGAQCEDRR